MGFQELIYELRRTWRGSAANSLESAGPGIVAAKMIPHEVDEPDKVGDLKAAYFNPTDYNGLKLIPQDLRPINSDFEPPDHRLWPRLRGHSGTQRSVSW